MAKKTSSAGGTIIQRLRAAHELIKNIQNELLQYMAGATQFDDIALLTVSRDSNR